MKRFLKAFLNIIILLVMFAAGGVVGWKYRPIEIPLPAKMLAELADAGYATHDIGTWHVIVVEGQAAMSLYITTGTTILIDKKDQVVLVLDIPIPTTKA